MTIEEEKEIERALAGAVGSTPLAEPDAAQERLDAVTARAVRLGDMSAPARESILRSLLHSGRKGRQAIARLYKDGHAPKPRHLVTFSGADHAEENAKIELKRLHRLWTKTREKKYSDAASALAQRFPHLAEEYRAR